MATRWIDDVRLVRNGESVSAAVANRPTATLADRTDYLRQRLDDVDLAEGLRARDVALAEDTFVGAAVYFNTDRLQFENALAESATEADTGAPVRAARAVVLGVVVAKASTTLGDVLLLGRHSPLDLAAAADTAAPEPGLYYLSADREGGLTLTRPAVPTPVLFYDGTGVYVFPATRDFGEDHVHYAFDLTCRPAGDVTPPADGDRHVITAPDTGLPGWLPAGHAVFNGLAPSRAAFGYNLSAHGELARAWPPVPLEAASLFLDRGQGHRGGGLVPLGDTGLAVLDANGLWWMSDCYDDVPWPTDLDTGVAAGPSSSSALPECPRDEQMRLRLCFGAMLFATDRSQVTSLTLAGDGGLSLTDPDGNAASRGPLTLRLDAALLALLPVDLLIRDGVEQVAYANTLYESFPSGTAATLTGKLRVPTTGLPGSPRVRLRLTLLAAATGQLPDLSLTYRVLGDGGATPASYPAADVDLALELGQSVLAGQYLVVTSDPIAVAAGDLLTFQLARSGSDGYIGGLGVLDLCAVLEGG